MVVESDDDGGEGGGEETGTVVEELVVASSDEDEVRAESGRKVNGKTKGRATGRTRQQPQKTSSKKVMEVEGSEEENEEEDIVHIDTQPSQVPRNGRGTRTNPATVKEKATAGGRGAAQTRREKATSLDLDKVLLGGQDAVAALIDKVERPSKPGVRKDTDEARLREKIGQVSSTSRINFSILLILLCGPG